MSQNTLDNDGVNLVTIIFLRIGAIITFLADLIAIGLFIREISFSESIVSPSERSVSLAIVVLVAFIFSISLLKLAGNNFSGVIAVFGVLYTIFAQFIFLKTAFSNMPTEVFSPNNFLESEWGKLAFYVLCGGVISIFARIILHTSITGRRASGILGIFGCIILVISIVWRVAFVENGSMPYLVFSIFIVNSLITGFLWFDSFK